MAAKSGGGENMTRLGMAVIDEFSQILRDVLGVHISHHQIFSEVKSNNVRLRPEQEKLVAAAHSQGYAFFDITLLYTLIRNVCPNVEQPTKAWGNKPQPGDTTLGDDIERIRCLRNDIYGHIPSTSISDTVFQNYWSEISDICKRVEQKLGGAYVQNLSQIENCVIDQQTEQKYQKMIEDEKQLMELVHEVIKEIKDIKEKIEQPKQKGKHKLEAETKIEIEIDCEKKRKQGSGDNLLDMAYQVLDTIVQSITKDSTVDEYLKVCKEVEQCGKLIEDKEELHGLLEIIESFQTKTLHFAQEHEDKIERISILSRFFKLVIEIRKYKGELEVKHSSLILHMTFQQEKDLIRYQQDVEGGEIERIFSECLLFEPFLSIFDLNPTDVIIKITDVKDYTGTQQADFPSGEHYTQSKGRSVSSIRSYRSFVGTMGTDPRTQHYVECTHCDRNARYYCNTCTDKLCTECETKHQISHASKHHDIVIYGDKTSVPIVELCQIHQDQPYVICCQQCEVPVCEKCIKEKHKAHPFVDLDLIFESKKEENKDRISKLRDQIIPKCKNLLGEIQKDSSKVKEEISKIQSSMTSKANILKDMVDAALTENTEFLKGIENSIISELQQQEKNMNDYIYELQNLVDEYERLNSANQRAGYITFLRKNLKKNFEDIPDLNEINLPSFVDRQANKEGINKLLGEIEEPKKSTAMRKLKNVQPTVKKRDTSEKPIPTATKMASFTAPGVICNHHISPVSADTIWVSDIYGHVVLTNVKSEKLNEIRYSVDSQGCHSTSDAGELIVLNENDDAIIKVTNDKKKPTLITRVPRNRVKCIYSSPSDGDLLVGMVLPGRVIRYRKTGKEVHQIQHDNTGQPLYGNPSYITENHINGDVCISDLYKHAVVVVDKDRNYRFSYTGHPPGSELRPHGISTDTQGHILVSDVISDTVQMTDKDGHFLSFLLTIKQGLNIPAGLSLDVRNNLLWVGNYYDRTGSVYKYKINQ